MALKIKDCTFQYAPAQWLPIKDRKTLDDLVHLDVAANQGKHFENPDFELRVVYEVENYFAADLFARIQFSDVKNEKLVIILPSPENAVFISVVENLNKYHVSCRNVHVFFNYEYANEKGDVAPVGSPYSRSGHFMRYFYDRLDPELRMPMEQIHFWTKENVTKYSDMIAAEGGADVCYTTLSYSGGIGAIDAETFPAKSMDELMTMGSRYVTPMLEFIAHESMRGMFGCSGDLANVPPCAVTIGPKDIAAAKTRVSVEYLAEKDGGVNFQRFAVKTAFFGPLAPENPASMLRTLPGISYVSTAVAAQGFYGIANDQWLADKLAEIAKKEAK